MGANTAFIRRRFAFLKKFVGKINVLCYNIPILTDQSVKDGEECFVRIIGLKQVGFILLSCSPWRRYYRSGLAMRTALLKICRCCGFLAACIIVIKCEGARRKIGGGKALSLWNAGMIYYFLLIMREVNWGRVFFSGADGGRIQYSEMGLYGQLVHPMVAVLILALLVALYKAKVWRALMFVKLPAKSFVLLLLFIFMSWVGEKAAFSGFHGQVGEELAEFGAYMMMYVLVRDMGGRLRK